jgi:hypothetical protein
MNRTCKLAIVIGILSVGGMGISAVCAAESGKFTEQQLEQARMARVQRLKLGSEAVTVLKNQNAGSESKAKAALAIGQLVYTPGIAVLIEQIDLKNPVGESGESDISSLWPCVRALADFGVTSVPALVEAYAKETQKERQELIKHAIVFGKAYSEAKAYTQGLFLQAKAPSKRKALKNLLKLIPEEEKAEAKKQ